MREREREGASFRYERSDTQPSRGCERDGKIRISNFSKTFTIRRGFTRRCTCWSRVEESMTNAGNLDLQDWFNGS